MVILSHHLTISAPRTAISVLSRFSSSLRHHTISHLYRFRHAPQICPYSSVVSSPLREQIDVPCRSNGSITLDILYAAAPSPQILLYLPPGPVLQESHDVEDRILLGLSSSSKCTVVRINYRLSPDHQFPKPVHDVLQGYDWVLDNLLHDQPRARLAVCGELVGGTLATTLALTECDLNGRRIHCAAINNPIADWVFPDDLPLEPRSELPEPNAPEETAFPADQDTMAWWAKQEEEEPSRTSRKQRRTPKPPKPTSWTINSDNVDLPTLSLSGERDVLFRKSEDYFDRFASPIHFFRSPHGKLLYPESDDILASSSPSEVPKDPLDFETQMDLSHYASFAQNNISPLETPLLVRCRAYARVFPPAGSNLSLPLWHFTSGLTSPLYDQTSELAKMIKRSIARQTLRARTARVHWHDPVEKKNYEAYAEERVNVETVPGLGLWSLNDDVQESRNRIETIGRWLRDSLQS